MPTPTPIPSNQIVQAVQASQNIIDNAVQQGIVGVLLLFGIAAVLYMAAQVIKVYSQRNVKPESSGNTDAIKAMAEMTTRTDEREARQQEERRLERAEWRKQILDRDEKFTEAVSHLGDGYNRMGDILERQVTLQEAMEADHRLDVNTITAMKADIGQMVNVGSVPLRGLIETVAQIKALLEQLIQRSEDCLPLKQQIEDLKSVVETLNREITKRTTSTNAVAQPASNVLDDNAAAADGKAAA